MENVIDILSKIILFGVFEIVIFISIIGWLDMLWQEGESKKRSKLKTTLTIFILSPLIIAAIPLLLVILIGGFILTVICYLIDELKKF